MAPIRDLETQRRGRQIGKIRLGIKVMGKGNRERPEKLQTLRFTSPSRRAIDAVAAALGGEVRQWDGAPVGTQWEVLTPATEIPVAVPPGDQVISQFYEMWSGGGCVRRCDGLTEILSQKPCLCPPAGIERAAAAGEGEACRMTTRVNLILPDLPDVGVWGVESHGYFAAMELSGAAELLAAARNAGAVVPAVLRLEQRQRKAGGQTRNFVVPVLEIIPTLRELLDLQPGTEGLRAALPPAPQAALTGRAAPAAALGAAAGPSSTALPTVRDAQECADLALDEDDRTRLVELGKVGRIQGWLDHHVKGPDDVYEPLGDLIVARIKAADARTVPAPAAGPVGGRGAPDAEEPPGWEQR